MICCLVRDPTSPAIPGVLEKIARACSPRIEQVGDDVVLFDASGLARVIGPPKEIGDEVSRLAAEHGMAVRVALAGTSTAACLLAHARSGITTVAPGNEAAALAPLPLGWLGALREIDARHLALGTRHLVLPIFERWGLRTLGDLAGLPRADLRSRFGATGARLHQAALGEDTAPLVAAGELPQFVNRLELEWPIEGLEPLSFVLARLLDPLSNALERADRGAVVVTTRLGLVTRERHERTLQLPAAMRDARVLRTLILLDLESHPPAAAIDVVEIELDVAPGRIVQGSLLVRTLPSPEDLTTLMARLGALMGESRIGAPALVDTHDERAVGMTAFRPEVRSSNFELRSSTGVALRRFRRPLAATVVADHGRPLRVRPSAREVPGGDVVRAAGPCRSSGRWWALDRTDWDRDAWDIELSGGECVRLARDRRTGRWEIEGVLD